MAADPIESTVQALTSANELLAAHAALILRVRASQKLHRQQLHSLESPPTEILRLSFIPSPPPSPDRDETPLPLQNHSQLLGRIYHQLSELVLTDTTIMFQRRKLFATSIRRDMSMVANGPRIGF